MRTRVLLTLWVALFVAGCGPQVGPEPAPERSASTAPPPTSPQATSTAGPRPTDAGLPTPEPTAEPPLAPTGPAAATWAGAPLAADRGMFFSASGACAVCHTQMLDATGADVSIDTAWRASMMANAARDPYWQAAVRGETLSNPHLQAAIEEKCATCHMPMARFTLSAQGMEAAVLDRGLLDPGHDLQPLALDAVSCTLCHQIQAAGTGEPASYSGGFVIDSEMPPGRRELFGPYAVPPGMARLMVASSGFRPVQGLHVQEAELCGTCHTLYTPYVDGEGQVAGTFPEQMAYPEWQASLFGASIPCQGCHMPAAQGRVQLSITGGPMRSPMSQHRFAGGNTYVLQILDVFGQDLGATASSLQFGEKQAQVLEQLQQRTATLELGQATLDGSTLTLDLAVGSMAGHKFPTSFPSRRAWIHLTVWDASGQVVFESGAARSDGSIAGNDNDLDPAAYEPHYLVIDSPEQVQIYEAIMGDIDGAVTTVLLRAAQYLKDNRLPPAGFDKSSVPDDIAVRGAARADPDFLGGSDRLKFQIALGQAAGPYTVTAELLYQAISYRWALNLSAYDAPEPARFLSYYEQVPNRPVVVATVTREVQR
jgi:hypothetical protein